MRSSGLVRPPTFRKPRCALFALEILGLSVFATNNIVWLILTNEASVTWHVIWSETMGFWKKNRFVFKESHHGSKNESLFLKQHYSNQCPHTFPTFLVYQCYWGTHGSPGVWWNTAAFWLLEKKYLLKYKLLPGNFGHLRYFCLASTL